MTKHPKKHFNKLLQRKTAQSDDSSPAQLTDAKDNISKTTTNESVLNEPPLSDVILKPLVQSALAEDLGRRGDITSHATIPADMQATLVLGVRQDGVVCGLDLARLAFAEVDASIQFVSHQQDGNWVHAGEVLATIKGNARNLLTAERTALNFMTHLSGIATATHEVVAKVADYPTQITCTRKTIPGLRAVQKYAVRCGGGRNHRMGLDDAILIKDNHIAIAGNIPNALEQARAVAGHLIPIEIEVDTLEQLQEALMAGATFVLLDNMDNTTLKKAVALCRKYGKKHGVSIQTEASGGVTPDKVVGIAKTGVDFIAMGYLTHSTTALDIGMDFQY